jgi:CO/xanthine dehydrogenase Mo-binding subunit
MNTGAYAENSPLVSFKTAMRLTGGYQWDAVDIVSYAVYTNTAPSSSHRMLGTAQSALSGETQIDEAAEALGMDPIAFRIKNVPARGERLYPNQRGLTADAKAALARLSDAIDLDEPLPPGRGRGVAFGALDGGGPAVGRSEVRVHGDGSVTLLTGAAELGQGSATVLGQIVAEEMGTTLDRVRVVQSNTLVTPYARSTGAGRTTSLEGLTVLKACREAKAQLREMAADVWEANPDDIVVEPPGLAIDGRFMTWGEVIGKYFGMADMEIIGRGQIRREGELAEAPAWWELAIAGVEVDVDHDTGQWRMTKLVTVADVGLAINPALLDGGDLGASAMGLGVAIGERFVYDGEQLSNPSLLDYRVPRFHDIPADVTCIVIENQDGIGPYGAKGNADGAGGVIHAAIANAIYRAVGVRLHEAPFLPERVLTAVEQLQSERRRPSDTNPQVADGSMHAN